MRRYETICILRPTLGEDQVTKVVEGTNAILSLGDGEIIALDKWGLRKLAYLIKEESNGYYIFYDYATDPANVSEMERKFRIDDAVMKYMTIKVADSIDNEGIETARGEYEAAKTAAAKAAEEAEQEQEEQSNESDEASDNTEQSVDETSGE